MDDDGAILAEDFREFIYRCESKILFDDASWVRERAAALLAALKLLAQERAALRKDAARYRWLKSRDGLELHSQPQPNTWLRMDGTTFSATHYLADGERQYSQAEGLDATIDAAMAAAPIPVSA